MEHSVWMLYSQYKGHLNESKLKDKTEWPIFDRIFLRGDWQGNIQHHEKQTNFIISIVMW
jgi:hypothetical protein